MPSNKKNKSRKSLSKFEIILLIIAAGLIIYLFFPDIFNKSENEETYMFRKNGELTFLDSIGKPITKINIEIAKTDFDRQLGLMYRKEMEITQGMLFIFPDEERQSFWMRNTNIPLDMIFVNSQNKIITIHKNTKPLSDQSYASTGPAKYVIETVSGFTDKFNINVGDKILWNKIN